MANGFVFVFTLFDRKLYHNELIWCWYWYVFVFISLENTLAPTSGREAQSEAPWQGGAFVYNRFYT